MPIHIEDIPALGIRWLGYLYFDCTLPMGSRTGCALFEHLSTALEFIVHEHGCDLLCHMLDDFLLVTLGWGEAQTNLDTFLWICEERHHDRSGEDCMQHMHYLPWGRIGYCDHGGPPPRRQVKGLSCTPTLLCATP